MYRKDRVEAFREVTSVLDKTENFIFGPLDKTFRANGTAFQFSPM